MFQVKRIDVKDDNTVYHVYNVQSKNGYIFFLLNLNGKLTWSDSRKYIPFIPCMEHYPNYLTIKETGKKQAFYAIESLPNREYDDFTVHHLIYYCSGCDKWHTIDSRDCIIEEEKELK